MEWDGTRSDDGGGAGGVALGFVCIRTVGGVMRGGWNESGWVRIGESLT